MKVRRGDVVILDYPYSGGTGSRVRPALIVQNDLRNQQLANTIVAMITSNIDRVTSDPTQLLVDVSTPDGRRSGLRQNSAVTCGNLFTVHEQLVRQRIGRFSTALMRQIDGCLKAALDLA